MDSMKLDGRALLAQAEMNGKTYYMKSGWRRMQIFAGICCCILILPIPLGIWIIIRARKARVALTEEGFAYSYLSTIAHRWSEIESFTLSGMSGATFGGGLVGAGVAIAVSRRTQGLKGPIHFKLRDKRMQRMIPAQMIENSLEMAMEMERLSGINFIPAELKDPS